MPDDDPTPDICECPDCTPETDPSAQDPEPEDPGNSDDANGAPGSSEPFQQGKQGMTNPGSGELGITEYPFGTSSIGGMPSMSLGLSNLVPTGGARTNGNNWYNTALPTLEQHSVGNTIRYVGLPRRQLIFPVRLLPALPAKYYAQADLTRDDIAGENTMTSSTGRRIVFYGFSVAGLAGKPKAYIMPNGDRYNYSYDDTHRVISLVRRINEAENGYYYSYSDNSSNMSEMTLRVAGQNVRRLRFEYVQEGEMGGNPGDLKFLIIDTYNPASSMWEEVERTYYRYYASDSMVGLAGGLKYKVSAEGCARLRKAGFDVATSSDAQIAPFAECYVEYDAASRRVTKCVRNGLYTHIFEYEENGGFTGDFGIWNLKTTQTLPDGNRIIHYTANRLPITQIFEQNGTSNRSVRFFERDSLGRVVRYADSSAIASVNPDAVPMVTLRTSTGLIREYTWHSRSFLATLSFRIGSSGPASKIRELTYLSLTVNSVSVYLVASETYYQGTGNTQPSTTAYSYTPTAGTYGISQRVTFLPGIPPLQHGTGLPAQITDVLDHNQQITWSRNERGFITAFNYDPVTYSLIKRIDDVQTPFPGAPTGWATPSGGGLNLVSDFENDLLGRQIQVLGPWHEVDLSGTAAMIRRAEWAVYLDAQHERRTAVGYISADTSACLVNPVSIIRTDCDGKTTDQIQAIRKDCSCGELSHCSCAPMPVATRGRLSSNEEFPQPTWTRWKSTQFNDAGEVISDRLYFAIPNHGTGRPVRNYAETSYRYDSMGRRDYVRQPGGTITRTVFTATGWIAQIFVGTYEPAGAGSGNTRLVEERLYNDVGNVVLLKAYASQTDIRETSYTYDGNHRVITTTPAGGFTDHYTLDNLGRVTMTQRRMTASPFTLLAQSVTSLDKMGRVYEAFRYSVVGGAPGNSVSEQSWYDQGGNLIKRRPIGRTAYQKMSYDSVNRITREYTAYNPDGDITPESVVHDIVVQQRESEYDAASNILLRRIRQRFPDVPDSARGSLGDPHTGIPARVYYLAYYSDGIGRIVADANFGTHGGIIPQRPPTTPESSDICLVARTGYNARGEIEVLTDPNGVMTRQSFDDAARLVETVANYQPDSK